MPEIGGVGKGKHVESDERGRKGGLCADSNAAATSGGRRLSRHTQEDWAPDGEQVLTWSVEHPPGFRQI